MSAKRLEQNCGYIDDSGIVSLFNCHHCRQSYYGDDSSLLRFQFCPLCGEAIDHTAFVPRNAEKQRRKALRANAPRRKPENREYRIRIERIDGADIVDHYNKKPHGQYWSWYECGYIVGGLSMQSVSNIGCAAVLASFRELCFRFQQGYRGYMEASLAMPEGQYRLTLMRDGIPSVSRIVDSVKPQR